MLQTLKRLFVLGLLLSLLAGCATVGRQFPVAPIAQIKIGQTSKEDLRNTFGEPWRTGVEDGQQTWTYGHYRYSAFGTEQTRDLVIRFNAQDRVASYTFNSTYPEDQR